MTKSIYTYQEYISDVMKNKIVVCKAVRAAVKRHLDDLEKSKDPAYPYEFIEAEANKPIRFFAKFIKGNEGIFYGKPIILLPWQQFITAMIFGWRRKDNGLRRFRKAYVQVGKKNGKSAWCGGLEPYAMLEENGAQVYSIAGKQEQAALTFDYAVDMITKSDSLKGIFTVYKHHIESNYKGKRGKFRALASDHHTADGLNPSFLVVDEYFAFAHSKLVNAVESGMKMRRQPLTFFITTAGGNKEGPCYELYGYLKKVLSGLIEDDRFFGAIYELDEEDDWKDETKWIKACPSLNVIIPIENMRDELKRAIELASEEYEFRTKTLNQWLDVMNVWIDSNTWKERNTEKFDLNDLKDKDCWGAIDLSIVSDLTAFTLYFRPTKEVPKYRVLHWCFIPEDAIQKKQETEHILYRRWIEDGLVVPTPGDHVDYDVVFDKIIEQSEKYHIKEIAFDPYNAPSIDQQLVKRGFTTIAMGQGIAHFSPWTKQWELAVLKGEIADPNPVMAWCLSNAVIKPDTNSNYKPLKSFGKGKIDLVITSIMAHARCTNPDIPQELEEYTAAELDAWGIAPLQTEDK